MNKVISEQSLQQQVAKLPKEMEPKRDLWPGIEKAIAGTAQQSKEKTVRTVPLTWAASVVVAVLVSWMSFAPQSPMTSAPVDLASVMQQDFEQQKQLMLASFGQPKLSQLPPEMQSQLDELSSARAAINKALANDPNNSDLLNLLRWTQKQEIDLLKQLYSPQWQTI